MAASGRSKTASSSGATAGTGARTRGRAGPGCPPESPYRDFILELDYAINEGGNSGIFIRSALEKNPAFTGHEMQILADSGRKPTKGSAGSLYDVIAATKNMSKPAGEWNHVRIVTKGRRIQITWNGEPTIDYETDRLTAGYLGLQNHDTKSVVRFRNIRITENVRLAYSPVN